MTEDEIHLLQEQQKLIDALRPFIDPTYPDFKQEQSAKELEYANDLRERLRQIQVQLDEIRKSPGRN